jgi:predicted acyl esterase
MKKTHIKRTLSMLVVSLFIITSLTTLAQGTSSTKIMPAGQPFFTKETFMVAMRDGIQLATDIYLPDGGSPPHGTIFIRTPYNKNGTGMGDWANKGWPSIVQDTRGRFQSQGNDTMFRDDANDGYDTLAWIATQNWSNGKVATIGGSATGIVQYLMAGTNPPALTCQYIGAATPNLYTTIYPGGEFRKNMIESWLADQGSSYVLPEIWAHENYTMAFWTNVSLEDNWQDVNVPAVHLGGWYDCFCQGLLDGFIGYQYQSGPGALGKSKLIVGPWTHALFGERLQGELLYPENAKDTFSAAYWDEILDQYILGVSTDFENRPTVVYYVMGDVSNPNARGNFWRYADAWPPQHEDDAWYLHENQVLSTAPSSSDAPLTYTYNPNNPVPTRGGTNLYPLPPTLAGPYDQRPVENRADVLLFTSDVLTEPYEATGRIMAQLYVSSDCPDTDFTVKLTDVYPDGRSMLVCDGILRMRNRNGYDHWEFMTPGEVYPVNVDLWSTSYIWNTGHRIRVAISSSNYPRYLANPNTMDGINQNTGFTIAHNTLYFDTDHPSCILLPRYTGNYAPLKPIITGPTRGGPGIEYTFRFNTTDVENENYELFVDWGDGTNTSWIGPFTSGQAVQLNHTWSTKKIFSIKAKARDVNGAESEWSTQNINIPFSIPIKNPLLLRILQRFPLLWQFIQKIWGLLEPILIH